MRAQHDASANPGGATWQRATQLLAWTIGLGLIPAAMFTWLELAPYFQTRDVFAPLLADGVFFGTAGSLVFVLVWCWLSGAGARAEVSILRARLITWILAAAPFAWFAFEVNRSLLPAALSKESLIANAGMGLGFLAVAEVLARALRAWKLGAWAQNRSCVLPLLLLIPIPVGTHVVGHPPRADDGPDVLFILLDVSRADHLGCYGYERPTSPNIDALAEDSILFEDFVAASTFTKTSIASIFTGLDAHDHGVYVGSRRRDPTKVESDLLENRFTTLAESMFDHGLNTVAWVENGQVRPFLGFGQGFSLFHDQPGAVEVIASEFQEWYAKWAPRQRYFAYLHVIDLHGPYDPRPPYLGRFGGSVSEAETRERWTDYKDSVRAGRVVPSEADIEGMRARYDELMLYVDDYVGRIVQTLKDSGRYDDTLIIVTSDHGEGFWEHGFIAHSNSPYDELVRVPLIIKMPNSKGAGRRVDNMVAHIDLAPTLLELVGAPVPEAMSGESFLPLLNEEGVELDPRWRYIEFVGTVGIRTERWKLIDPYDGDPVLYDMVADPEELHDLFDAEPEVAAQLMKAVERAHTLRKQAKSAESVVLDQDTIENLEALGYL